MGGAVIVTARFGVAIQIVTGFAVFCALCRPAGLLRGEEFAELERLAVRIPFWSRLRGLLPVG